MKKSIFAIIFSLGLVMIPAISNAGILPPCTATGNCGFCDMLFTVNVLMRWITIIAGSAALLFFVLAGVRFVISRGNAQSVAKAQEMMKQTLIGVIIVFVAWISVNLIVTTIAGSTKVLSINEKNDRAWYQVCKTGKDETDYSKQCLGSGDGYPCRKAKDRDGHCEQGTCVLGEACLWLAGQPGYTDFGYSCRTPASCGLLQYEECDTASNCIKNLCMDGTDNVCCYPKK